MLVNTITCHNVYNAGATLQAYALQHYLVSLGHQSEIIDYFPVYQQGGYRFFYVSNKNYDVPGIRLLYVIIKLPGRIYALKQKRRYDSFTKDYLNLTRRYESISDLRANPPISDAIFAGSDQIWNASSVVGRDPAFYLDFADKHTVKASYAASFSDFSVPDEYKSILEGYLKAFDYISVREKSGLDILKSLSIQKAWCVLDPVFLLSVQEWKQLSTPVKNKKRYLLVYDFDNNSEIKKAALKLAKENNLQIRTVERLGYGKWVGYIGPTEFLGWIIGAEIVLSNSFHATAFSIIFHKPFLTFARKQNLNSRLYDLTEAVGLSNRMLTSSECVQNMYPIDYSTVDERVKELKKVSIDYIDMVLSEVKDD